MHLSKSKRMLRHILSKLESVCKDNLKNE